jgi:hypothetical protein
MIMTVAVRNVFGNELVYPADDTAALLAALAGKTTFSAHHLQVCRALGYVVHVAGGTLPASHQRH